MEKSPDFLSAIIAERAALGPTLKLTYEYLVAYSHIEIPNHRFPDFFSTQVFSGRKILRFLPSPMILISVG